MFQLEKLKVDRFLGFISLRTGAFVIGCFEIVMTIFYLLLLLVALIDVGSKHNKLRKFH